MAFRFLHTADLHLDSPLRTLALRDAELGASVANATRQAFLRIVEACLEERVDALVIAGDLYDGEIRSMATPLFIGREFRRLAEAGIAVFIVRGNHDAEASVTRHLSLPDNVTVFSGHGGHRLIEASGVAIHGVSFPKGRVEASLLPKFGAPVQGVVNIGILHTSLAGAEGHDVYAPCTVAGLVAHGFDYWALGHVHKRQVHATRPFVVMPGMPQGRDAGEAGPKSATLVTIADDRSITLAEVPTAVAEFHRVPVDLGDATDWRDVADVMIRALTAARAGLGADVLVARPVLSGTTPLAYALRRDADRVLAEARQAASIVGRIAIDKVELQVSALETKGGPALDPLAELRGALAGDLSPAMAEQARGLIEELRAALPVEIRDRFGRTEAETMVLATQLLREGAADVLARLADGGEG